ncbi:hypothetical protein D3C87_1774950 [compost metagenome]
MDAFVFYHVYVSYQGFPAFQFIGPAQHHSITFGKDLGNKHRLAKGNAKAFTLADGVKRITFMLAYHHAIAGNKITTCNAGFKVFHFMF